MQEQAEIHNINRAFVFGLRRRAEDRILELTLVYNRYVELENQNPHFPRSRVDWIIGLIEINKKILEVIGNG